MVQESHLSGEGQSDAHREPDEIRPLVELCRAGKLFAVQEWIRQGKPVNPPPPKRKGVRSQTPLEVAIDRGFHSLVEVETTGQLRPSYAYPVQTWKLGDGPLWVILGGEVVVDYAIRLKTEIRMQTGVKPVWVAGYANDVMAYIPSLRVLKEGGYEGEYAMLYYGRPGIWAQNVEEIIVGKVHEQVQSMLGSKAPAK